MPKEHKSSDIGFIYKEEHITTSQIIQLIRIVYGICVQVKKRLGESVAVKNNLVELQNEFRRGRKKDDKMFTLTQCTEKAD